MIVKNERTRYDMIRNYFFIRAVDVGVLLPCAAGPQSRRRRSSCSSLLRTAATEHCVPGERRVRRRPVARSSRSPRRVCVIVVAQPPPLPCACVRPDECFFDATLGSGGGGGDRVFLFSRRTNGKHYFVDRNPVRMRRGNNAPRPAVVH